MNVRLIETGEIIEVNDIYGCRLIGQGKAVIEPEKPKKTAKAEAKAEPKEEPEQKAEPEKKTKATAKKKE